jgi:hypothetical protein
MAIFTLTDIKFKGTPGNKGASQILESRYISNTMRYPIDIGNTDQGHYMVIHVNQQTRTQFTASSRGFNVLTGLSDSPTAIARGESSALKSFNTVTPEALSAGLDLIGDSVKSGAAALDNVFGNEMGKKVVSGVESIVRTVKPLVGDQLSDLKKVTETSGLKGLRTIERTTETIALYMPDTLNFTHDQKYSEPSLGGGIFGLIGAAADAGMSIAKSSGGARDEVVRDMLKNLTPFIGSQIAQRPEFGNAGIAVFASNTGTVINPQLELIYSSPAFRQFRFDFMFYPRSEKEAIEVQSIIETLKFHQAPEILNQGAGGLGGFFLVPPSEFDIKFYYNGSINPNIPEITTCVLTQIDTDYAPNGFATYEKPGKLKPSFGGTGMPVAIRLSLQFMETQIITKGFLDNGKVTVGPAKTER